MCRAWLFCGAKSRSAAQPEAARRRAREPARPNKQFTLYRYSPVIASRKHQPARPDSYGEAQSRTSLESTQPAAELVEALFQAIWKDPSINSGIG